MHERETKSAFQSEFNAVMNECLRQIDKAVKDYHRDVAFALRELKDNVAAEQRLAS